MKKFKKLTKRERQVLIMTIILGIGLVIFGIIAVILLSRWGEYIAEK